MNSFVYHMPSKLHFGAGKLAEVGEIARPYGSRALVVTGRTAMKKTGILDKVVGFLKDAGIEAVHFGEVEPNPTTSTVDRGAAVAKDSGCHFILGLGGGSSIDAAKAIAVMATTDGSVHQFFPSQRTPDAIRNALPIIAIPTTAGTGTEANPYAVLTHPETNEKPGLGNPKMYPAESIIDPELMLSVPPRMTAATGCDVLFHAMEAYLSTQAQPLSDMAAEEAVRIVAGYLQRVYENGSDLEARSQMAWASTLAGIAINTAGTIVLHAMAHPVSGHLDAVHAEALSALSTSIIGYNTKAAPQRMARLAGLLGAGEVGDSVDEIRDAVLAALRKLLVSVNMPISLGQLGVKPEMAERLAEDAFATMAGAINNNPKRITKDDMVELYRKSI